MNRLLFIGLVLTGMCSVHAVAQSPKKINKELKQSVVVASARYDSLKTAFSTALFELENRRLAIQSGRIHEFDIARAQFDRNYDRVQRIGRKLEDLGVNYGTVIDYSSLYKANPIYSYPKMIRAAVPLFSGVFTFTTSEQNTVAKEMPLGEQNTLLQEALKSYALADSLNRSCLISITNSIQGIAKLDAQLDSCILDLQNRNKQFDEAWNVLHVKYQALRVEYERSKNDKDVLSSLHKEFGLKNGTDFEDVPISSPTFFQITQEEVKKRPEEEVICEVVDISAQFPNGMEAMKTYIKDNLDSPESVTSGKVSGKCYLKFVISAYGSISNVKVQRGVPGCKECDDAAIELVRRMPKWIPAMNNGNPVNCYYNLPIPFKPE